MKRFSLRTLLILLFLGGVGLFLVSSAMMEVSLHSRERADDRRLDAAAQLEGIARHADIWSANHESLEQELAYQSARPDVIALVLLDTDGKILAASRREWIGGAAARQIAEFSPGELARMRVQPLPRQQLDLERQRLIAWQPFEFAPAPGNLRPALGALLMVVDLAPEKAEVVRDVMRHNLFMWGGALFVLLLMYLWMARYLVIPLQSLRLQMERFDPVTGVAVTVSGPREVVALGTAFNAISRDLAATWQAIPDLLFELDASGVYWRVAAHREDLLAAPSDNLLGRSVTEVLPPDAAGVVMTALADAERHNAVWGRQFSLELPGGRRWFEISVARKAMGAEVAPRFVVISRDITDRHDAEAAREEAFDRLRKIAARLPGMVFQFRLTADGRTSFPYASEAIREIFHVSPAEVAEDAAQVLSCVDPEDRQRVMDSIRRSAETLAPWREEYRIRLADDTVRWLQGSALPQREDDGAVLWHGFTADITATKHAAERQHLLAKVVEASREGVMMTSVDGTIVAVNPAFSEITGYRADEVIGRSPQLLNSGRHGKEFFADMWASIANSGYWTGELWNRRKDGALLPERLSISAVRDEGGTVTHYAAIFSDLTELKASQAKVEELAWCNVLTGKPNRAFLLARVDEALRARRSGDPHNDGEGGPRGFALALINLRGFQRVNSSYGFDAGDALLQLAVQRIESAAKGHLVCHLEGDEFALLLDADMGLAQIEALAELLLQELGLPYLLDSPVAEITLGNAVGIALYPENGDTVSVLMQQADAALKAARREEGSAYRFARADLTEAARHRIDLEARLRHALKENQLRAYFQPQIDIRHNRLIGAEALVRWQDPQNGLIPPGEFIPLAEETGMIVDIGGWMLREACRQGAAWIAAGYPSISIAVNVAAQQLLAGDLVQVVEAALDSSGFPPAALEIELTESTLMKGGDALLGQLERLRELNIGLSIDDFGTGYSSLAYLQRFPVSKLKIDKCFVDHLPDRAEDRQIVAAVVALGHSMKLDVLAEGVERSDQMEWLERLGCDSWQGYLKSRPLPADEFEQLVFRKA